MALSALRNGKAVGNFTIQNSLFKSGVFYRHSLFIKEMAL
jgi:hypothetical protein